MLSLFTALFTNAMQAALDGTKCKDIDGKEVSRRANEKLSKKLHICFILCLFTFLIKWVNLQRGC